MSQNANNYPSPPFDGHNSLPNQRMVGVTSPIFAQPPGVSAIQIFEELERAVASKPKSWPQLIGKSESEARVLLLVEEPDLQIEVLTVNQAQTLDYRPKRVRLIVDKPGGTVVLVPRRA